MTTVTTLIFLTLAARMASSGSWLGLSRLELRPESSENAAVRALTVTCERFLRMGAEAAGGCASSAPLPPVSAIRAPVNASQRVQDGETCTCDVQQLWLCLQAKTSRSLHRTHIVSKVKAALCSTETFLTQAGRVKSVRPDGGTWKVEAGLLATVLLFGTYVKRMMLPANSDSSSTVMMLLIMTLRRFTPRAVPQFCEWPHVAVLVSSAASLAYVLTRAANASPACRVARRMMMTGLRQLRRQQQQQQLWTLPLTLGFLGSTCRLLFLDKVQDVRDVGWTLRCWALLELLVTLYCVFFLLPSLLQLVLMKVNFLSVHLHVQLVTCLQNSRGGPTKYVLVMKIHKFM